MHVRPANCTKGILYCLTKNVKCFEKKIKKRDSFPLHGKPPRGGRTHSGIERMDVSAEDKTCVRFHFTMNRSFFVHNFFINVMIQ